MAGFTGTTYIPTIQPQVANSVGFYSWCRGVGDIVTNIGNSAYECHPLPDYVLRYGEGMQIVNSNEQAGDNYIVNILLEEWVDD